MQKISDDLNKMKCLSFCGIAIRRPRLILLQVINCERKLDSGFPLQIHRLTTTLHVKPITMGPPRGSLKGLSTMNGKRQALSYGPTGIVRLSIVSPFPPLMVSGFEAGSGKSVLWWVTPQPTSVDMAYIGD